MINSAEAGATENEPSRSLKDWLHVCLGNIRLRALAICFAIGLAVCLIELVRVPFLFDFFDTQEVAVQDRFFSARDRLVPRTHSFADEIILICADSDSARRFHVPDNRSIPRHFYADLVREMQQAGAETVLGLALPLEGSVKDKARAPGAPSSPDDDGLLVDALRDAKNTVISSNVDLDLHTYELPYTPFVEALGIDSGSVGNGLIVADRDGKVRHAYLAFDQFTPSVFFYKSFALRVAEKRLDAKAITDMPGRLFLKKHTYPTRIRLNFAGPPRTFKMIPLWRALDWKTHIAHNGLFLPSEETAGGSGLNQMVADPATMNPFQNKIVLVGLVDNASENKAPFPGESSEHRFTDSFITPVNQGATPMSAIEIQANTLSNLLHDRFLDEPEPWKSALISMFLALLLARVLGIVHTRPWVSLAGVAVFAVMWVVGAFFVFVFLHVLMPVVVPIEAVAVPCWALVVADANAFAKRERRRRTRVFRSMAAKPLAQEIERRLLVELGLEGKQMNVTVMACQLRNFIGARQEEPPEAVMQRLNACLSVMMDCIGEHHGLVERIWNCGVIGIWGAPIAMTVDKQAKLATDCGLAIRKHLFNLHDSKDIYTGLNFNFTCGISTGESICGTINAIARDTNLTQYGALGPAVDLAIEMEALNVVYGTTFMLSDTTAAVASKMFEVREIDRVKLSHKEGGQPVYELLPWEGSLPGALEEAMALFKQGRTALEAGRIKEAEQLFSAGLRMVPHDKPTIIMLDRCREIIGKTPGKSSDYVQKTTLKERLSEGRD